MRFWPTHAPVIQRCWRTSVRSSPATRASEAKLMENPAVANDPDLLTEAATTQEPSLAGRTVGPYRVRREIGGGNGVVYLAEDTRLGRLTALKALPPVFAESDERRERLRREARAAAALSHPSVATVHALEEIDGALFIASEYIDGRSLRDEIRQGPLKPGRALGNGRHRPVSPLRMPAESFIAT